MKTTHPPRRPYTRLHAYTYARGRAWALSTLARGASDPVFKLYPMEIPQPTKTSKKRLSMLINSTAEPVELSAPLNVVEANDPAAPAAEGLLLLPLVDIHRNESQPRTVFDQEAIHALATSIQANGVIQPIAVRPRPNATGWEIIAGERRWLAAQRAGLSTIPAVVHHVDARETLVLALVENIVREDLSPLETARAYAALQDEFGMSITELANSLGKSRPAVSNTLRLLELPDAVLELLRQGRLTEGHGRALLGCSDRLRLTRLARLTVDRSLSVRALEGLVREEELIAQGDTGSATRRSKWNLDPDPELVDRTDHLCAALFGARTRIKMGQQGAKLELHYDSPSELVDLVKKLEQMLETA